MSSGEKHARDEEDACGSPPKRLRQPQDPLAHLEIDAHLTPQLSPATRAPPVAHTLAADDHSKWNEHFANLIEHPTTTDRQKGMYEHIHKRGTFSLFPEAALAHNATELSIEQLSADLLEAEIPDSARDHIRRGSFGEILEMLKDEAQGQPDGIHPEVEFSLCELTAMLQQKPPPIIEVPGLPVALYSKAELSPEDIVRMEREFGAVVTAPTIATR
mmetsp:Transcript_1208/g.4072  ORF Transcript_1208/g.4072 Transcript_1208/m.4072 type:complete len:216 (+) Transcript_1208:112-759(+)|eukprot:CAMPEP_0206312932 /NCGR_PEP_ID=MMETSP0106_2-20121207/14246_1 /ASSEMBLY_ACC=CAM_ASM_000206 /TAXON_ID=81532 /ORGANISM="Acanthoeca-like sp., Strain 10tr" /LENGTH=215 /DNA_ID=CAMNT_0053744251 /DNA_START=25 /DNA_END=672 /DNA_ORIENTATION=-